MGFFSNWKKSSEKSRLMKSAAAKVQSGGMKDAVEEICAFYKKDEAFSNIIDHFKATPADVESIIKGIMFSGFGGSVKGHYVPVSAVLFHDTLAYMLRVERGQVSKSQAYFEVQDYFNSGSIVFQPERAFH
ncbi:hypothetical protein [Microbulbifer agarilyticus]|uniref:hypothetical protein n=1 Tax=Microbulbifer agarilyticus TaxID=260552 RepID=UPI001CD35317|nr:hypothetical protein [Microbulbifer agarilyticus]MCA0894029.1 hypothetical protein [Microbulbifer agarilyticus]